MIINQGMLNQPTSLSILRDELTKLRDAGKTRDVTLPARYEGKPLYSVLQVYNASCYIACCLVQISWKRSTKTPPTRQHKSSVHRLARWAS
jgi:hypothetical protein